MSDGSQTQTISRVGLLRMAINTVATSWESLGAVADPALETTDDAVVAASDFSEDGSPNE